MAMSKGQHVELLKIGDFDMAAAFKQDYVDLLKYYYVGGMPEVVRAFADEDGLAYMTAYIVSSDARIKVSEIKRELADNLASFMIPEFIVKMPTIPLNDNGKPDTAKLPVVMKAGALCRK